MSVLNRIFPQTAFYPESPSSKSAVVYISDSYHVTRNKESIHNILQYYTQTDFQKIIKNKEFVLFLQCMINENSHYVMSRQG